MLKYAKQLKVTLAINTPLIVLLLTCSGIINNISPAMAKGFFMCCFASTVASSVYFWHGRNQDDKARYQKEAFDFLKLSALLLVYAIGFSLVKD